MADATTREAHADKTKTTNTYKKGKRNGNKLICAETQESNGEVMRRRSFKH